MGVSIGYRSKKNRQSLCKSNAKADKKLIFTSPTSIIWNGNYILIGWKNNYLPAKLHFSGLWSFLSIIFANLAWEYSRNSDSDINHPVPSISSKIFHTREFSLDENHFASKNNADRRPIVVVRQKCSDKIQLGIYLSNDVIQFVKAIGGGPGSFLQVKLILKYSIPRSERFLRN